jgi:hypothetical protein
MPSLFNKLPGFVVTPPGKERPLLRRLPGVLFMGSLLLALPSLAMRLWAMFSPEAEWGWLIERIDLVALGGLMLHWTIVPTVAIAAFIVLVMKGPAYVADDPYPLDESETPD